MTTKKYNECDAIVSVPSFWVNSTGCPGEFQIAFKHFKDLKNWLSLGS